METRRFWELHWLVRRTKMNLLPSQRGASAMVSLPTLPPLLTQAFTVNVQNQNQQALAVFVPKALKWWIPPLWLVIFTRHVVKLRKFPKQQLIGDSALLSKQWDSSTVAILQSFCKMENVIYENNQTPRHWSHSITEPITLQLWRLLRMSPRWYLD